MEQRLQKSKQKATMKYEAEKILPWDDLRRAIQIPASVIEAGMTPNKGFSSNKTDNTKLVTAGSSLDNSNEE